MLIDINLLPQKEAKNKSLLTFIVISCFLLFIGGAFAFWINATYTKKLENIEQQIATAEQLVASEQQKITAYESASSIADLENAVKWAKSYPIKTVPILKNLTALLPERGFIQSINYEETGLLQLTIQFEMSREAAYYLNSLLESDWVTNARLETLDAVTGFYDKKFGEPDAGFDDRAIKNEKYIPRYLGLYEIELNREVLKASGDSSHEEGGDGL
ncbi:hypothetical protein PZE06_01650 [Robertmurraya sp. DFI.2.37]|jgi:type IV pilus assembly protein PilN|uniref:PilN domain-containing protein n=1 Tax=Robertmurraya sp. DFI.2.37 TaxID=3031819 RepID=UPI00124582A8|nr:hypothetical protein [Robertmurraya sp. DFI.2.37]MDF1506879.1 hypothetical protein [Robertmurraya sp. DFI.2.37]